jgi:hypothetical protein
MVSAMRGSGGLFLVNVQCLAGAYWTMLRAGHGCKMIAGRISE